MDNGQSKGAKRREYETSGVIVSNSDSVNFAGLVVVVLAEDVTKK